MGAMASAITLFTIFYSHPMWCWSIWGTGSVFLQSSPSIYARTAHTPILQFSHAPSVRLLSMMKVHHHHHYVKKFLHKIKTPPGPETRGRWRGRRRAVPSVGTTALPITLAAVSVRRRLIRSLCAP